MVDLTRFRTPLRENCRGKARRNHVTLHEVPKNSSPSSDRCQRRFRSRRPEHRGRDVCRTTQSARQKSTTETRPGLPRWRWTQVAAPLPTSRLVRCLWTRTCTQPLRFEGCRLCSETYHTFRRMLYSGSFSPCKWRFAPQTREGIVHQTASVAVDELLLAQRDKIARAEGPQAPSRAPCGRESPPHSQHLWSCCMEKRILWVGGVIVAPAY